MESQSTLVISDIIADLVIYMAAALSECHQVGLSTDDAAAAVCSALSIMVNDEEPLTVAIDLLLRYTDEHGRPPDRSDLGVGAITRQSGLRPHALGLASPEVH